MVGLLLAVCCYASRANPAESGETLESLTAQVARLDESLAALDSEEKKIQGAVTQLGINVQGAHARVVRHGRALYRLTRSGLLPVGGGFDSFVSHAIRVERARREVVGEMASEQRLREEGGGLAKKLEKIVRDRAKARTQREVLEQARIEKEQEEMRRLAFESAFETSTGPMTDPTQAPPPDRPAPSNRPLVNENSSGFGLARGKLPTPVIARPDYRVTKRDGTDGPGIEFRTGKGAPVRAVYEGRVAFADKFGPHGRVVILDHGDNYYTLTGNLGAIEVRVGDDIAAGGRIGSAGGDENEGVVYFEVRRGNEALPPKPWLGR
jgi:septal ring factor EnvC (AmiA/AmiB activator)